MNALSGCEMKRYGGRQSAFQTGAVIHLQPGFRTQVKKASECVCHGSPLHLCLTQVAEQ